MPVKYVFVTGGVVSGLGKGITAASLGRLLKARGYKVTMQKFDRIFDSSFFALVQETLYLSHFRLIFLSNLCLLYCVLYRTVL